MQLLCSCHLLLQRTDRVCEVFIAKTGCANFAYDLDFFNDLLRSLSVSTHNRCGGFSCGRLRLISSYRDFIALGADGLATGLLGGKSLLPLRSLFFRLLHRFDRRFWSLWFGSLRHLLRRLRLLFAGLSSLLFDPLYYPFRTLLLNDFLNNLDFVNCRLSSQKLVDENLLVALLLRQILNGHLELVKRVLHTEQVVQIKWEVHFGFLRLSS